MTNARRVRKKTNVWSGTRECGGVWTFPGHRCHYAENAPLSTGLLYPKFRGQSSGIIQKLYETRPDAAMGVIKSVY